MLVVQKLSIRKKGFRARISAGWYVVDTTTGRPLFGPLSKKEANDARDTLKKGSVMTEKKKVDEGSESSSGQGTQQQAPNTGSERPQDTGTGTESSSSSSSSDKPAEDK